MAIRVTRRDVVWSYLGYGLSYGLNLALLPFVLRWLNVHELGLWYTFLGINQFVMLLDFGLLPTVGRNVSFCWGGATSLSKEGIASGLNGSSPNMPLLAVVVTASRRLYGGIGFAALLLMTCVGTPYVLFVARDLSAAQVVTSWIVFTIGVTANIRYAFWYATLRGIGAISESHKALVISRAIQLGASLIGLSLGAGLFAVAAGFFAGGIATRVLCRWYYLRYALTSNVKVDESEPDVKTVKEVTAVIRHGAWRQGVVAVGNALSQRSDVLVCSLCLGLTATAALGLTQQLFTMVSSGAAILLNTYLPVLSEANLRGDRQRARHYLSVSVVAAWLILVVGTLAIAFLGPAGLTFAATGKPLLSTPQCLFLGAIWLLEINHMIFYAFLTSKNYVPQPGAWMVTGGAVLGLSVLLTGVWGMGMWGLLWAHFVAQAVYNNWRWPASALADLDAGLSEIARLGCKTISHRV